MAQDVDHPPERDPSMSPMVLSNLAWVWCYIDGPWKETDALSGLGWLYFQENVDGSLVGARNLRWSLSSLSSLHSELETFIWAMHCMIANQKMTVAFATDCAELVKMVSTSMKWPAFTIHLEEYARSKELLSFSSFCSSLVHITLRQTS